MSGYTPDGTVVDVRGVHRYVAQTGAEGRRWADLLLLDRENKRLASAVVELSADPPSIPVVLDPYVWVYRGPPLAIFNTTIAALPGGHSLVIQRDGVEIWRRTAPAFPPRIDRVRCKVDGATGWLGWTDEVASGEHYEAIVRWFVLNEGSEDEPRLRGWLMPAPINAPQALPGAMLPRGGFAFDPFCLPAGKVWVQVIVRDGFHTVASTPIEVVVPPRPIRLETSAARFPGAPWLTCMAQAHSYDLESLPEEAFCWLVNGVETKRGRNLSLPWPMEWQPARHILVGSRSTPGSTAGEPTTAANLGTGREKAGPAQCRSQADGSRPGGA